MTENHIYYLTDGVSTSELIRQINNNKESFLLQLLRRSVNLQRWDDVRELLSIRHVATDYLDLHDQEERNGWTVLHMTCYHNPPLDVVESMMDICPEIALTKDNSGDTALFYACWKASEEVVMHYINVAPESVSMISNYGGFPLHYTLSYKRSPRIVEKMLCNYPAAATFKDCFYKTPMNRFYNAWICDLRRNIPNLELLPTARDDSGYFTLKETLILLIKSLLFKSKVQLNFNPLGNEAIQQREERTMDICSIRNTKLLLHHALYMSDENLPSIFKKVFILTHLDQISKYDPLGNLPLHIAASQLGNDTLVLDTLLNYYPNAAKIPDKHGRLPLVLAIQSGKQTLRELILAAPQALTTRDITTHLYPFLIAASTKEAPINAIYELIRHAPEIITLCFRIKYNV